MTYNLTEIDAAGTIPQWAKAMNTVSKGWLFPGFLLTLFLIMFISMAAQGMRPSLAYLYSSLVCLVLAVFGLFFGVISMFIFSIFLTIFVGSVITFSFDRD